MDTFDQDRTASPHFHPNSFYAQFDWRLLDEQQLAPAFGPSDSSGDCVMSLFDGYHAQHADVAEGRYPLEFPSSGTELCLDCSHSWQTSMSAPATTWPVATLSAQVDDWAQSLAIDVQMAATAAGANTGPSDEVYATCPPDTIVVAVPPEMILTQVNEDFPDVPQWQDGKSTEHEANRNVTEPFIRRRRNKRSCVTTGSAASTNPHTVRSASHVNAKRATLRGFSNVYREDTKLNPDRTPNWLLRRIARDKGLNSEHVCIVLVSDRNNTTANGYRVELSLSSGLSSTTGRQLYGLGVGIWRDRDVGDTIQPFSKTKGRLSAEEFWSSLNGLNVELGADLSLEDVEWNTLLLTSSHLDLNRPGRTLLLERSEIDGTIRATSHESDYTRTESGMPRERARERAPLIQWRRCVRDVAVRDLLL